MKKISFITFAAILLTSCSSSTDKMEQESLDCFSSIAEGYNVNLDSLIQNIEENLVSEEQLDGTKGVDFVSFLKKMQTENKTSHLAEQPSTALFLELNNLPVLANCKLRFKNDSYQGSKMESLDQSLAELGFAKNISPKTFAEVFLGNLEENDYTKKYYKVVLWKIYAELFISGPDISRLLPLKNNENENLESPTCPTAFIDLTSSDSIFWNKQDLSKNELFDSVSAFIGNSIELSNKTVEISGHEPEKVTDYIIYLSAKPSTSYGLYIDVQNIIIKSVNELRTETSRRIFNMDYFDLNELQSKEIESIIRKTVIER